ncbi:hypothetical protein ABNF97_11685 [Plantactinospora sp. B6F1]|uniref:hypothetical protein n=1 Tax=Plantactinospora sp. B6F1 TaxID=3158971 RepID=UPI0032D989FE
MNGEYLRGRAYRCGRAVAAAILAATTLSAGHGDGDWSATACGTGEIVEYGIEHRVDGDYVRLAGWTVPCEPPSPAFYLVVFTAQGGWMSRMYSVGAGTEPTSTPFTAFVDHAMRQYQGPALAACLAYDDYNGRLSCVAVEGTGNPTVYPISVHDVRVATPSLCGYCGNCVGYVGDD